MDPKLMDAKFPGRCNCGVAFQAGARVEYDRDTRKVSACMACKLAPRNLPDLEAAMRATAVEFNAAFRAIEAANGNPTDAEIERFRVAGDANAAAEQAFYAVRNAGAPIKPRGYRTPGGFAAAARSWRQAGFRG